MGDEPLTLKALAGTGRNVVAQCTGCGHEKTLSVRGLLEHPVPGKTLIGGIAQRLRCSECNSREVITFAESERNVRQGRGL